MKKLQLVLPILAFVFLTVSCEYEYIQPKQDPPVDPSIPVSFSQQVLPVFTTGNNCTSCHNAGGTPPDLTPENAYSSIINGGMINSANPQASVIYDYPSPASETHAWKKYTNSQASLILTWIQQSAQNN